MATIKNTTINDTGYLQLPSGTTAQRPVSPVSGMARFNTDDGTVEFYNGSTWSSLSEKPKALGGEISFINGYYVHIFKGSGCFTVLSPSLTAVDVLLVGGGGGGGSWYGGGGGAGGLVFKPNHTIQLKDYSVIVGAGGLRPVVSSSNQGMDGTSSSFAGLVALGGGGGGSGVSTFGRPGGSGGSSSGTASGGSSGSGGIGLQPSHPSGGFGNPGGTWASGTTSNGGGGGAGAAGSTNGAGGDGLFQVTISSVTYNFNDMFGNVGEVLSGESWFAGGGTGGCNSPIQNPGRGGGGGASSSPNSGFPATANTGGGGGGQCTSNTGVGNGGSGIVIIRYLI